MNTNTNTNTNDPHPECGGTTVACTCHGPRAVVGVAGLARAYPPEQEGETSADVAALIPKEVG